jgi:hypothetical protein
MQLDDLIERLGGEDAVAELTGRKERPVKGGDGMVRMERRRPDACKKGINMAEKYSFMNDEKQYAIISEAASTGISLQADKRVANRRRRLHITLELPVSGLQV